MVAPHVRRSVDALGVPGPLEMPVCEYLKDPARALRVSESEPLHLVDDAGCRAVIHASRTTVEDHGTAVVADHCTAASGVCGRSMAGDYGTATAEDCGLAMAGHHGTAVTGDSGHSVALDFSTAKSGYGGTAVTGHCGRSTTGHYGSSTAGSWGRSTAGDHGRAAVGHEGKAMAGRGGMIEIAWWDSDSQRFRVAVGYVGENGLKADTPYKWDGVKFCEEPDGDLKVQPVESCDTEGGGSDA